MFKFDDDLVEQVFNLGEKHLHEKFFERYGCMFDPRLSNITGFDIPEAFYPQIIEIRRKVVGFALFSTLVTDNSLNYRVAGAETEIKEYVYDISPKAVATSLISWIDSTATLPVQKSAAYLMEAHMAQVFEKSPAKIILNAPLNYNPKGYSLGKTLQKNKGYAPFSESYDDLYSNLDNQLTLYKKEGNFDKDFIRVKKRFPVTMKGLTITARAKIEAFEQRYNFESIQNKHAQQTA